VGNCVDKREFLLLQQFWRTTGLCTARLVPCIGLLLCVSGNPVTWATKYEFRLHARRTVYDASVLSIKYVTNRFKYVVWINGREDQVCCKPQK